METLTRYLPLIAALALVLAGMLLYRWLAGGPAPAPTAAAAAAALVADGRPTLVELGMDSCASCKAMKGVLDELRTAHGDRLRLVSINIARQPDQVGQWKVLAIPTQVLLDGEGREFYRHIGFLPAKAIRERFAAHGLPLEAVAGTP